MKKYVCLLGLLIPLLGLAQQAPPTAYQPQLISYPGVPFGSCDVYQFAINLSNGDYYSCGIGVANAHTWTKVSGSPAVGRIVTGTTDTLTIADCTLQPVFYTNTGGGGVTVTLNPATTLLSPACNIILRNRLTSNAAVTVNAVTWIFNKQDGTTGSSLNIPAGNEGIITVDPAGGAWASFVPVGGVSSVGLTVNGLSNSGIASVTNSPIGNSGNINLNLLGTTGGIACFGGGGVMGSSVAYVAGDAIVGGGTGCPTDALFPPELSTGNALYYDAPAGMTTCDFAGTVASCAPSTNINACGSQAIPCQDISTIASKLNVTNIAFTGVVTIQLARTQGGSQAPSGLCYQPQGVIINGVSSGSTPFDFWEHLDANAVVDTYPTSYLYLVGDTATPANVVMTGATTCAGTTPNQPSLIKFVGTVVRVQGITMNYMYGSASQGGFGGGLVCERTACYLEDMNSTSDGGSVLVTAYHHSYVTFGSSVGFTVTNVGIVNCVDMSNCQIGYTPLGRPKFTVSLTTNLTNAGSSLFLSQESSHLQVDGVASFSLTGTGINHLFQAQNGGHINWSDASTFKAPAQTWTINDANTTIDLATDAGEISDALRTVGQLTATFTACLQHARAASGSFITYLAGSCTNPDLATHGSTIQPTSNLSVFQVATYQTTSNCAVNSVSPAACGAAASGAFVVPTGTTAYTVNTTAVTAASRITITPMSFAGNLPSSPTCVVPTTPFIATVSAISAGTSFSLTLPNTTGQTCWQYWVVN